MEKQLTAQEYLDLARKEAARVVDEVIAKFDFTKARACLESCNWKYAGADSSPSIEELQKLARETLQRVIQSGSGCTVYAGPIRARAHHYETPEVVSVELSLVPVHETGVYVDFRVYALRKMKSAEKRKTKKPTTPAK